MYFFTKIVKRTSGIIRN